MSLIYRTAGAWGGGKGSDLAPSEVDSNFYQLSQAVAAKAAQGVGIDHFMVAGAELTVVLTDGSNVGPYPLPVATITFAGTWTPSTAYFANQIFTYGGSTYIVLLNHTSASSFDPGANDGSGHPYYGLILSNPASSLPIGGAVGAVLTKSSTADFVVLWALPTLAGLSDVLQSPAPLTGQLVYWAGGAFGYLPQSSIHAAPQQLANLSDVLPSPGPSDGDAVIWSASGHGFTYGTPSGGGGGALADLSDVNIGGMAEGEVLTFNASNSQWENEPPVGGSIYQQWTTSTKTLALSDINNWIDAQGGSQTLTIPEAGTLLFPDGASLWLKQWAQTSTLLTIVGESGTNFVPPVGRLAKPRTQGSLIKITYMGSDMWEFDGDLGYDQTTNLTLDGTSSATQHITPQYYNTELYPVTVSNNQTYVADSAPAGQRITFVFTSSGTTSCTITFSTGFKAQGTLATGTVTGKTFTVSFIGNGTNLCETSRTTAM